MWTAASTRTGSRTSGRCSSAALHGTYVSVGPEHLFRYLDERVFTFNERRLADLGRSSAVLAAVAGKRLTWAELTS